MSKCPTCGKTVYFAERFSALGKDYHKLCFKCVSCKKQLELGKFSERDGQLFCKMCYNSRFQDKGYGFGGSGGTLSSYTPGTATVTVEMHSSPDVNRPSAIKTTTSSAPPPPPRTTTSSTPASSGSGPNFCPQCGAKCAGARFCPGCGQKL
ncbi:cysteine-rich protein 2 [Pelomyxa schiedti]|nr:cysteine-rich protein 2 [Pelomyxa schiedti]